MPPKPPRGHGPALAVQRIPAAVIAGAAGALAVAFVVMVLLDLSGALDALGALRYGLVGGIAALIVIVPRYFSFAAGEGWVRRGDNVWVDTHALVTVAVDGDKLLVRDTGKRTLRIPARVLRENVPLRAVLDQCVHHSAMNGQVSIDPRVPELLQAPA